MSAQTNVDTPGSHEKEAALREIVQRHRVYWQVWPEQAVRGSKLVQVGFRIGLLGTHDHPQRNSIAGCPECWKVYRSLCSLAQGIVPQQERASEARIAPFDASLLYSPGRERKDVMLTIQISNRGDPGDERRLGQIKERLLRLGAPQGTWSESPVGAPPPAHQPAWERATV
jgi:hypothetical protein